MCSFPLQCTVSKNQIPLPLASVTALFRASTLCRCFRSQPSVNPRLQPDVGDSWGWHMLCALLRPCFASPLFPYLKYFICLQYLFHYSCLKTIQFVLFYQNTFQDCLGLRSYLSFPVIFKALIMCQFGLTNIKCLILLIVILNHHLHIKALPYACLLPDYIINLQSRDCHISYVFQCLSHCLV